MTATEHNLQSTYREQLLEHLFVGEILRRLWRRRRTAEVLKPQVDATGYDLAMESNGVLRHIQLKSSYDGATTARVNVSRDLERKPNGCVVWLVFDEESLKIQKLGWFGAEPGEKLPSLTGFSTAKHTKANAQGMKGERPNLKSVPKGQFDFLDDQRGMFDELIVRLFG